MNRRQVRCYEVLNRLAHVRQTRTAFELSAAIAEESKAAAVVAELSASYSKVAYARVRCLSGDPDGVIKDYALLSGLSEVLHERREAACRIQLDAQERKASRAEDAVQAQRFAQSINDEMLVARRGLAAEVEARALGESLDVWMQLTDAVS